MRGRDLIERRGAARHPATTVHRARPGTRSMSQRAGEHGPPLSQSRSPLTCRVT